MTCVNITKERIEDVSFHISDKDLVRSAIIAELDATSLYEVQIGNLQSEKAREIIRHIMLEEKEHIAELYCLLNYLDDEQADKMMNVDPGTCMGEER